MNTDAVKRPSPFIYFILVFALSIPIWIVGAIFDVQLLPGLPLSSLMTFCPVLAAAILIYREKKLPGVGKLLKRSFDFKRIKAKVWYLPVVLLIPAIMVLSYFVIRLLKLPIEPPQFTVLTPLVLFAGFFIGALGEELGWSGYIIDPLQERWSALQASLILGVVWAGWHVIPFLQIPRAPEWIFWQCLNLVASRALFVWLYNNTGKSVFAMAVFHATINLSWQLFPIDGSYYDPRVTGLITAAVAIVVVLVWGAKTMTRKNDAQRV